MKNNSIPQQPYYPPLHNQSPNHWKTFAIILLIVFIVGIALWLFKSQMQSVSVQNTYQQKPPIKVLRPTSSVISTQTEQNQFYRPPLPKTGPTMNKVFYTKYYPEDRNSITNNLFAYDYETKEITQLTHYTEPQFYISNIRVIDENFVGFLRCSSSGDYADCGIYVIDIDSKKITEKKKLERQMFIDTLEFSSLDSFAYFGNMRDESKSILKLILINQDIMKTLEQVDVSNVATGRGGFLADDTNIQFTPNRQHLLQIDTNARSTEDFNIYIYNLTTGTKQIIENATHPQWVNDTTIIYRKYPDGGIYLYDIAEKKYKKIDEISQNAYYLSMLQGTNKLLFTDHEAKQLWLYNLTTKENKKILDGALQGFWLTTPTKIVYNEVRPCTQAEECGMLDYKVLSVSIFDIEKMTKIGSIPDRSSDENYLYNMSSYYSSQY